MSTAIEYTAKTYTSAADMIADGKARRERMMLGSAEHRKIKRLEDALSLAEQEKADKDREIEELRAEIREVELDRSSLQATVMAQADRINGFLGIAKSKQRPTPKAIIAKALKDFPGVTVEDVIGLSRKTYLVSARHACIKAVHEARPDLSSPQIGRLFQRDHTTILATLGRTKKGRANGHAA